MVRADKCERDLIKDFIVEYALNPSFTADTDKDDDDEADDKHTSDEQDRADDEQDSDDDPLGGMARE